MPITVECGQCKKKYRVGDASAGKKVKCKACGNTFLVPAAPAAPPPMPAEASFDDLAALAALEPGGPVMEAAPLPPMRARAVAFTEAPPPPPGSSRKGATAFGRSVSAPAVPGAPGYANPYDPKRFNRRPTYPYNALRDLWLPRLLIFFGFVLPMFFWIVADIRNPHTSVTLLGTLIFIGLLIGITIPTMGLGLNLAARATGFEPVDAARLKTFAAFCTPFLFALAFAYSAAPREVVSESEASAVLREIMFQAGKGFVIGLVLSLAVLWFFLRVGLLQAFVSWLLSGLFFIIGYIISVLGFVAIAMGLGSIQKSINGVGDKPHDDTVQSTPAPPPAPSREELAARDREVAERTAREKSDANLHQIVAALKQYAAAHEGNYPPDLETLVKEVPNVASYLRSPLDRANPSGYVYLYLLNMNTQNTGEDIALAYDDADLAKSNETSVAFANGSVRRLSRGELDAARERSLDIKRVELTAVLPPDSPLASAANTLPMELTVASVPMVPQDPNTSANVAKTPAFCRVKPDAGDEKRKISTGLSVAIPVPGEAPPTLFYSTPSGNCVMLATESFVSSWDLASTGDKHVGTLKDRLPSDQVAFSPDGVYMVLVNPSAPNGGEFGVFSFKTGTKLRGIQPENGVGDARAVGFVGSAQLITATSTPKPMLQTWDLKTGVKQHDVEIPASESPDTVRAFSATGRYYAVVSEKRIKILNLETGQQDAELDLPARAASVRALCFSNDGAELTAITSGLAGGSDIQVYDLTPAGAGKVSPPIPMLGSTLGRHTLQYLPDKSGWLVDDANLVDRVSGKTFYALPPLKSGSLEGRAMRMLDLYTVLIECKRAGNNQAVVYAVQRLPKADVDAALKSARDSVKAG